MKNSGKQVLCVKNEKANKILLIAQIVVTLLGLSLTVAEMCSGVRSKASDITNIVSLEMYALILFYVLFSYRAPHGNLFRYCLLIYALVLGLLHAPAYVAAFSRGTAVVAAVLIAFMCGRLHKLKQCTILSVVILAILLASAVYSLTQLSAMADVGITVKNKLVLFNQPFIWFSFAAAYLVRFSSHKQAGENEPVEE